MAALMCLSTTAPSSRPVSGRSMKVSAWSSTPHKARKGPRRTTYAPSSSGRRLTKRRPPFGASAHPDADRSSERVRPRGPEPDQPALTPYHRTIHRSNECGEYQAGSPHSACPNRKGGHGDGPISATERPLADQPAGHVSARVSSHLEAD